MTNDELEALWADPENWRGPLGTYCCAADPRIIVPKRVRSLGWTINAAHRGAFRTMILIGVVAMVPPIVCAALGRKDALSVALSSLASLVVVCGICWVSMKRSSGQAG